MSERTGTTGATRRLRSLRSSAFVDFCAELWAERGYAVDAADGRIRARQEGVRLEILPVRRRPFVRSHGDGPVDVVVTPVDAAWSHRLANRLDARLVGPVELESMLRYGVDRDRADALFERYVGEPLSAVDATAPGSSSSQGSERTPDAETAAGTLTTVVAVAGVACLVLAAVFAGVYTPNIVDEPGAPPSGTNGTTGASTPAAVTAPGSSPAEPEGPPGFDGERLDADRFAAAHAEAVDDSSYRLVIQHSGTQQPGTDRQWKGSWQQVVVDEDRTFLYSVVGYAQNDSTDSEFVQFTVYSDGHELYRQSDVGGGSIEERYPVERLDTDTDRRVFTAVVARHIAHYFATSEVRVEQPTWSNSPYRVVATGQPRHVVGSVSDYEATAMVDENGFVSSVSVSYLRYRNGTAREVQFRFEYARVGDISVSRPSWYTEARDGPNAPTGPGANSTAAATAGAAEPPSATAATTRTTASPAGR